jgi:two-component system, NtrC family, nitrogen regulation sensor histidine kinase NtrY
MLMDLNNYPLLKQIFEYARKFKFLLISALFFILIFFSQKFYFAPKNPDPVKFSRILNQKVATLHEIMQGLAKELKTAPSFNYFHSGVQMLDQARLKESGYLVLIYEKDSLKYWSDNTVAYPTLFSNKELGGKVAMLDNGVYTVETIKQDNYLLVGLILIKHKYPYTNEYLSNNFENDFNLPASTEISSVKLSFGIDINDNEGNYMFSLSNRFQSPVNDNPNHYILLIFYYLGIISLFFGFSQLMKWKNWLWLPSLVLLIVIRLLMLKFRFPLGIISLSLFQPEYYADPHIARSMGDLLINVLIFYLFSHRLYIPLRTEFLKKLQSNWQKMAEIGLIAVFVAVVTALSWAIQYVLESLVAGSKIPFDIYKVQNLTVFTLIGIYIISLIFAGFKNIIDVSLKYLSEITTYQTFSITSGAVVLISGLLVYFLKISVSYSSIAMVAILLGLISYIVFRGKPYHIYTQTLVMAVFSAFTVIIFYQTLEIKDKNNGSVLVSKMVIEQDLVAEQLLKEINDNLGRDDEVRKLLEDYATGVNLNQDMVFDFIKKKYFKGYLEKYDLEIGLCGTTEYFSENNKLFNCKGYLESEVQKKSGKKINDINFYFIDKQDGSVGYTGSVDYILPNDSLRASLFVNLSSRAFAVNYSYPQVLLEKRTYDQMLNFEYSYAKYINNQLMNKTGQFNYGFDLQQFGNIPKGISHQKQNSFDHIINTTSNNSVVIISKPSRKLIDMVISFSYIFVFFNLVYGLVMLLKVPNAIRNMVFDYKTKIQLWMVVILLVSFLSVGGGTIYYTVQQFENRINKDISERSQSVHNFFDKQFGNKNFFLKPDSTITARDLTDSLSKISKIFFTDINLYDPSGNLIASSRPEIFDRGLMGRKMNSKAFSEMAYSRRLMYFQDEEIGSFGYTSAYVALLNDEKKPLMYMNLPYISKPEMLKNERSVLFVTVVNLYMFLFLFTLSVAVLMANKITKPLRILLEKFKNIELGRHNQLIDYKSKDEVGNLVIEYNRMVEELARNIDLLAKTEREMAWREMAKQIAHEIKNPLTPMKLSVQYLMRAMAQRDQHFEKRLEGVAKTMIENIDNLSRIATEFSSFAKMPTAINEEVNIVEKIQNTIRLFENEKDVTFKVDLHENSEIIAWVDKEQISRVFINLVKNAIQAVPEERAPIISIEVLCDNKRIIVVIEDNGNGISADTRPKIFVPNFTTKSSGTGLGLAIVKNIIEHARGKIWFETEEGKGSRFYVELPVYQRPVEEES